MLDVCLLGTAGMMPLPHRWLTAALMRYNGSNLLIDCGEGTQIAIKEKGWTFKPIDVICFTHYHADHISGLPGLLLTMGNAERTEPLTMIGPKGLEKVVSALRMIAPELPFEIRYIELTGPEEDMEINGYHIHAFKVNHNISCYGYTVEIRRAGRFDVERARNNHIPQKLWNPLQKGQTVTTEDGVTFTPDMVLGAPRKGIKVTYCTDTRPTENIVKCARHSDLFICEGMYAEKDKIANFLLIEEPEAHIHTHIQKALFDKLNYTDTQIIYSTHSTHISEVSNISNMNILGKFRNYSEVYQPFIGLKEEEIVKTQRFLDAIRSNLLFAKSVILVEGDAEEILIPIMVKQTLGVSLDELGISIINIRSTGFENLAQLFHNQRIKKKCAIITDLDTSITGQKTEASKRGKTRKEKLDALKKRNKWIGVFYAPYTFEIDFLKANNKDEVLSTIKDVYVDKTAIQKSEKDINSKDIKKYGKRILTMANYIGKGWYAILLSNYITPTTCIPNYILDAILFVKPEYSEELLLQIFSYVVSRYEQSDKIKSLNKNILKCKKGELPLTDLIKELYEKLEKEEPILYILNRL